MRALDLASRVPWAIRPESLQQILDIAARVHDPDFEAAATRLAARQEDIDFQSVAVANGKPLAATTSVRMRGSVAVLPVTGPIFRYGNMFSAISGATTIESMSRDLNVALKDEDVSAIVVHVDSPGGEVNGTGEFANMLYEARGKKPIWAYVSNEGCSAAYWIASACDKIVCAPTSVIGSIGVVAAVPDPSKDSSGRIQFVSSQSPNKRPDPTTKDGKDQIQTTVDDLAAEFVATVARNRGVTAEHVVSDFGEGGVMVGQKAVNAGLADAIGTFEQCLIEIAQDKQTSSSSPKSSKEVSEVTGKADSAQTIEIRGPLHPTPSRKGIKKGFRKMNLKDRLIQALAGVSDEDEEASAEANIQMEALTPGVNANSNAVTTTGRNVQPIITAAAPIFLQESSELAKMRQELVAEREARRRIEMERISERANAFALAAVNAGKFTAATQTPLVTLFEQLALVDSKLGAAQFPDGSTCSYIGMLENLVAAQPKNMLDQERLPAALQDLVMLRNELTTQGRTRDDRPMSDERRRELLGQTHMGQQVLESRNGSSRN